VWQGDGVSSRPTDQAAPRLHRAARVEDAVHDFLQPRLLRRGWQRTIIPYTGYGAPGWVRILGRVRLTRPDPRAGRRSTATDGRTKDGKAKDKAAKLKKVRGWRSFTTLAATGSPVVVEAGGYRCEVMTDRAGYIDTIVEADLAPGWGTVLLSAEGVEPIEAAVRIIDPRVRFGIVSDIDDTVMVTALPRPLLAAWHTFVLDEHARASVAGMAVLYERLVNAHPGAPVLYLSTGAWNVAPALTRFLARHLYPAGPLLLTDWGPTPERWFRSGQEHKRATLTRLAKEFPHVRWLLIGDDGQHDEEIYAEFAAAHPDNVAAVAIRHLSPAQTVLAGGLPMPAGAARSAGPGGLEWLSAPDGAGLAALLREVGLL